MNAETTRHPNWIPVEPADGAIRKGDRYRSEFVNGGSACELYAGCDWERDDFDPNATYYVWPRPEPKPYEAIPEGRENAAVMAVSVDGGEPVVATYWRGTVSLHAITPLDRSVSLGGSLDRIKSRITSAVPVTVVPTAALTRLRGQKGADGLGATTPQAIAAFLAAIDGADQ